MSGRRSFRARLVLSAGFAIAAVAPFTPAIGATYDTGSLIERTCRNAEVGRHPADTRRMATLMLADLGVVADNPVQWITDAFGVLDVNGHPTDEQRAAIDAVRQLQETLANQDATGAARLGFEAAPLRTGLFWLFSDQVSLFCIKRPTHAAGAHQAATPGLAHGRLDVRLRSTADQLNVTGNDRRAVGAAQLSYLRERVADANGAIRHDDTVSAKGTLGLVIDERPTSAAYLYAGYELQRLRTTPPPTLAPGASQRDKDTDVLQFGITGFRVLPSGNASPANFLVSGTGSVLLDRVHDSSRLRVDVTAVLGLDPTIGPIPVCGIGYFFDLGIGLGARCNLTLRLQANHFLDRGTSAPAAHDDFFHAGGEVAFELAPMRHARLLPGGVIAGASYRYETAISGNAPDIDRFSAYLKYRQWVDGDRFALEFGFNFVDGTNPDSFADDHRLSFSLGVVF
jgi:hypothetical protein